VRLLGGEKEGVMTTWQLFIQGLGYLMLFDIGCALLFFGIVWWESGMEQPELEQWEDWYAREGW